MGHFSFSRSYVYLAWACPSATHYSAAHEAWWTGQGGGLEGLRGLTGEQGGGSPAGQPVFWEGQNINPDLGPDCPYNQAYYTDDSTNWYGFRALPIGSIYRNGSVWSGEGDLDARAYAALSYGSVNFQNRALQYTENGDMVERVYRLREGIARFFITDINNPAGSAVAESELPVMLDGFATEFMSEESGGSNQMPDSVVTFNHVPGGCNVLYMDGHANWVRYAQTIWDRNAGAYTSKGEWPVTNGAFGWGTGFLGNLAWGLLGKG